MRKVYNGYADWQLGKGLMRSNLCPYAKEAGRGQSGLFV